MNVYQYFQQIASALLWGTGGRGTWWWVLLQQVWLLVCLRSYGYSSRKSPALMRVLSAQNALQNWAGFNKLLFFHCVRSWSHKGRNGGVKSVTRKTHVGYFKIYIHLCLAKCHLSALLASTFLPKQIVFPFQVELIHSLKIYEHYAHSFAM